MQYNSMQHNIRTKNTILSNFLYTIIQYHDVQYTKQFQFRCILLSITFFLLHFSSLFFISSCFFFFSGVGFPVDMPVMLTYFEGNELMPVLADYPDYDHLMNHVAVQLDGNEFQLYRTTVVLTLQGDFEVRGGDRSLY